MNTVTKAILSAVSLFSPFLVNAENLRGIVIDKNSKEPLIGATVIVNGNIGVATDVSGNFEIKLPVGHHSLKISYIGYEDMTKSVDVTSGGDTLVDLELLPADNQLDELVVTATVMNNTESAMTREQKESDVVQSGVSSQQIQKTQDKDASEVVRRVPGVSIIDDKFVMVRGLSQRYNNVWLNGSAVPSSEADSRAFSFDIIPAGQIDNMVIVKSPAPEYPSDFSGGFIMVNTKQTVQEQAFNVSLGLGYNDRTTFQTFLSGKGSGTDFLGFDNGFRSLSSGINTQLNTYPGCSVEINPLNNGLNNDWNVHKSNPFLNIKLALSYANTWKSEQGHVIGLLSALNYSSSHKKLLNMENSLFGPYDVIHDKPVYLRKAVDNQYDSDVKLGAMLNMSFRPFGGSNYFEWKNIFNQIGKDRYSDRNGYNAQPDNINNMEYYYSSRTTYNTQFSGSHEISGNEIDWSVGYAYANRNMPDRRLIERTDRTDERMSIYRIGREFTKLDEHIGSFNANYKRCFELQVPITLKAGLYGEYRTRQYKTRQFQYGWKPENNLPLDWNFDDNIPENILVNENYGPDKLYLFEEVNFLNNYSGKQGQIAGYVSANATLKKFTFYAGLRYEYVRQTLGLNTRQFEESIRNTNYDYSNLFPSVNIAYRLSDKHQLRVAYGRSTNRPEFRELSPSVYYDFDLGSNVMGNYDLKPADIQNVDFRYEWYPSKGEQLSVALFYKHFKNPIEWTYTVAGGTDLVYSYMNAVGANNFGIEIDIRKSLDFIGLNDFSLSFNGSLIKSRVTFPDGTNNIDRPMQGQSPYLVNLGLFYNGSNNGWNAAILYNIIGKRIIGVGNRYGNASDGSSRNIPNSYEMPRNTIDLSVSKKWSHWEVKLAVRDLIAQPCVFKQYEELELNGKKITIDETNRKFKPGRDISITVGYNF